jgi:hypothetical protein
MRGCSDGSICVPRSAPERSDPPTDDELPLLVAGFGGVEETTKH